MSPINKKEKMKDKKAVVKEIPPPCALLFELETVALRGRGKIYEAWKKVFDNRGVELSKINFMRYGLNGISKKNISSLLQVLGKQRLSHEKIAEELQGAIQASFQGKAGSADSGLMRLIKLAQSNAMKIGAISVLPTDAAMTLAQATGFSPATLSLLPSASMEFFPAIEAWKKLADQVAVDPLRCIAVVSTSYSSRMAIMTGMRCIAYPDDYTAFQDFSGADITTEKLEEKNLRDLLALLKVDS